MRSKDQVVLDESPTEFRILVNWLLGSEQKATNGGKHPLTNNSQPENILALLKLSDKYEIDAIQDAVAVRFVFAESDYLLGSSCLRVRDYWSFLYLRTWCHLRHSSPGGR